MSGDRGIMKLHDKQLALFIRAISDVDRLNSYWIQEYLILIIITQGYLMVQSPAKRICNMHLASLFINKLIRESRHPLLPACLLLAQVLRLHKVQQIIMVHMYLKGIRSGLEIMAPGLSCFYDGQHLLVVNRISSFGRGHGMQQVCDRSEFAVITFDTNHSPDGELRRIGLEAEFVVLIGVLHQEISEGMIFLDIHYKHTSG